MKKAEKKVYRTFTGLVERAKMEKTLVVRVDRVLVHPRYGKRYVCSKRYKVHDELSKFHEGDTVRFQESRPISKEKRWRVMYPSQ